MEPLTTIWFPPTYNCYILCSLFFHNCKYIKIIFTCISGLVQILKTVSNLLMSNVKSWTLTTNYFQEVSSIIWVQFCSNAMTDVRKKISKSKLRSNKTVVILQYSCNWILKGKLKTKVTNNAQLFDGNCMSHNVVGLLYMNRNCGDFKWVSRPLNAYKSRTAPHNCCGIVCGAYALFGSVFNLWRRKCVEIYVDFFLVTWYIYHRIL